MDTATERQLAPLLSDDAPCRDLSTVCPACGADLMPEHAHYSCPRCGYRDSCCF
jgi:ribosomal protein S27AE